MRTRYVAVLVLDQLAFGTSSILLIIGITRWSTLESAGAAALLLVPYILASSFLQGCLVDSLLLAGHGTDATAGRTARQSAVTFGLFVAPIVLAASLVLGVPWWAAAFVTVATPLTLAQFVGRSLYLAGRSAGTALLSDVTWLFPLASVMTVWSVTPPGDASFALGAALTAWAIGGGLACVSLPSGVGCLVPRSPFKVAAEIRNHRRLGFELLLAQGGAQTNALVLAGFGSTVLVGTYRASQTLTTPALLIVAASRHPFLPWLVRRRDRPLLLRRILTLGVVCSLLSGLALAVAVSLFLNVAGRLVFGEASESIARVAPILAFGVGISTTTILSSLILRTTGRAGTAVKLRAANASAQVIGLSSGAAILGTAVGAALGLLLADAVLSAFWVIAALRERPPETA